jgi:23S rRNA U2552 (ribose-2'-O)-methylase RlmE/FtsJ
MIHFLLPNNNAMTYKMIHCESCDNIVEPLISHSLSHYLYDIKEKINMYDAEWDICKKYTNPYEYIHTNVPLKKKCISKYKPLSRSYFKMIEIMNSFGINMNVQSVDVRQTFRKRISHLPELHYGAGTTQTQTYSTMSTAFNHSPAPCFAVASGPSTIVHQDDVTDKLLRLPSTEFNDFLRLSSPEISTYTPSTQLHPLDCIWRTRKTTIPIRTFHLAEGPGGFIEAIVNTRKCPTDVYVGMTILDDKSDYNIPAWKKSEQFLSANKNVIIENGEDQTGNILSIANLHYCKEKYGSTMDIITADGGFDFSENFNSQEISIGKLLFAQICFAVSMQKKDGDFILKIFDCFMAHTIDLLCILSSFYEKVYITKPQTSRYANSEKYVVCRGFLFDSSTEFYPYLSRALTTMLDSDKPYIRRFLKIPVSHYFLTKLEEYNSIFGQQQIENIHNTILLIENKNKHDKIENLLKTNVQKCINWCLKYNVPYHNIAKNVNAFVESSNSFADVPKTTTNVSGNFQNSFTDAISGHVVQTKCFALRSQSLHGEQPEFNLSPPLQNSI